MLKTRILPFPLPCLFSSFFLMHSMLSSMPCDDHGASFPPCLVDSLQCLHDDRQIRTGYLPLSSVLSCSWTNDCVLQFILLFQFLHHQLNLFSKRLNVEIIPTTRQLHVAGLVSKISCERFSSLKFNFLEMASVMLRPAHFRDACHTN